MTGWQDEDHSLDSGRLEAVSRGPRHP